MFPTEEAETLLQGPAGHLDAILTPCATDLGKCAAVICHPHPQMQGTMHNKVVTTLAKTCSALGMPVVRFNYRGVGQSDGEYADGVGEVADTLAVLDWLKTQFPDRAIWLAGFSFGGAVAYKAALQYPVAQLITVSPSVIHFNLAQDPEPNVPWLVVQGESDEVIPPKAVYTWLEKLVQPPTLIRMPDCSHFFHRQLVLLKQRLLDELA